MEDNIDRFKKIVDNIFDGLETSTGKEGVKNLFTTHATSISADKEEFAKEKALEELEKIRVAFLEFQDSIRDLMLFNYMTSSLQHFAEYANDLSEVIEDDIDESKLTPESLEKYKSIKKMRAQILSNVFNKYKKK